MIVVKVEYWPGGEPDRARVAGQAAIAHTRGHAGRADYDVVVQDDDGLDVELTVRGHPRGRGVWPLAAAVVNHVAGRRDAEVETTGRVPARVAEEVIGDRGLAGDLRRLLAEGAGHLAAGLAAGVAACVAPRR